MAILTSRRDIPLKSGTLIPKGTKCTVSWEQNNPSTMLVLSPGFDHALRLLTRNAANNFEEIESFNREQLAEAISGGECHSVLGNRVEPDGWDPDGSPSWLLALGVI